MIIGTRGNIPTTDEQFSISVQIKVEDQTMRMGWLKLCVVKLIHACKIGIRYGWRCELLKIGSNFTEIRDPAKADMYPLLVLAWIGNI